MADLVEIADGVFITDETSKIDVAPASIESASRIPPLFRSSIKQDIGHRLVSLAKEHSQWVAASADKFFGRDYVQYFSREIEGMISREYISLLGNHGLLIEPTKKLVKYYHLMGLLAR